MTRIAVAVLALLLTACDHPAEVERPHVFVDSKIVETLPDSCPAGALACAEWSGTVCRIYVRADIYPRCIGHEMRHCHEGQWHDGETIEGC